MNNETNSNIDNGTINKDLSHSYLNVINHKDLSLVKDDLIKVPENSSLCVDKADIIKVPGDGHCFISSIIKSVLYQLPFLDLTDRVHLLKCIETETLSNIEKYSEFLPIQKDADKIIKLFGNYSLKDYSNQCLIYWMYQYLVKKNYSTPYGDIVPLITANTFNVNIGILEKLSTGYEITWVLSEKPTDMCVCVHKSGEHYDSLLKCVTATTNK